MAQSQARGSQPLAWEKPAGSARTRGAARRLPFLIGGIVILAAVAFLIASGTIAGARFFITVNEVVNDPAYAGQSVRVAGAVIGDTITYDAEKLLITFTVAHIPEQFDDLAAALHEAVGDPNATQMRVVVENSVKPELLQHEAQAIMTGRLGADGVFYASELNLKCPTRFIEAGPAHEAVSPDSALPAGHPSAADGAGA
ncbi:MAG: cytochrome c maturation protein CcmE [Anaerolineae bacterium]|nr:cytochrome c maturation protein CcmE [Anaerolineae bacterium]NUQ05168.1 cytochrome c maturation protein CcmE [Anaerolineae bacterium]